jgi:hypothetical protein
MAGPREIPYPGVKVRDVAHVDGQFGPGVPREIPSSFRLARWVATALPVQPGASARSIKREIVRALHPRGRRPGPSDRGHVDGASVRLAGTDPFWHEREAAERAASHATGAAVMENGLSVQRAGSFAGDVDDEIC